MNHSTRAPTRYEAERIEAMMQLGCVACAVLGIPYSEVQCHHILDGGIRMGHWFSLPVCAGHHKGEFTALQRQLLVEVAEERGIKGSPIAAIHTGRKPFSRVYGTEKQLWIRVQSRLRLPAVWPTSKILPRRLYAVGEPNQRVDSYRVATRESRGEATQVLAGGENIGDRVGGETP